jgi:hypothetical protein
MGMRSRLSTQQIVRGSVVTGLIGSTMLLPLIAATPSAAAVNLCGHPADTLPPQISSVTFSTQTVVTTHGPQVVTLTADATDTATSGSGSGVKHIRAYLTGPHGSFINVNFRRSTGTTDDGTWTGAATFTKKDWPGSYRLQDVSINDAAGNYQDYPNFGTTVSAPTAISLQTGWDSQLTLSGPTPVKPKPPTVIAGKLSKFLVSPSVVNTTKSTKRVNVTVRFKGHQPHFVFVNFFRPPQPGVPGQFINLQARLRPSNHSWHGHFTVPRWVGNMKPQANLEVQFGPGFKPQFRNYSSTQLKALGFASAVDITSTVDRTPPKLTKFSFTPNAVNTHTGVQTVAIKASATDAVSGVKQIEVSFERNSNLGIVFGAGSDSAGAASAPGFGRFGNFAAGGDVNVRLTRTGSQWTGTATFRECVPTGKWHVSVQTFDNANNGSFFFGKRLTKLGFANTLQVAAAPQYVFDPVVTAATAGGAQHQITLDFDNGVQNLTTSNLTAYAMSPADTRYQTPLPITSIQCSNGSAFIDCSGSGGLVSSAVLTIPGVVGKQHYEVWADLDATTSQITDAGGLPVSWQYAIAQVKGA